MLFSHLYWHKRVSFTENLTVIYHHFLLSQKGKKKRQGENWPNCVIYSKVFCWKQTRASMLKVVLLLSLFFFYSIARHWTVLIEACFADSNKYTFCVKCASEETKVILNLLEIKRETLKSFGKREKASVWGRQIKTISQ